MASKFPNTATKTMFQDDVLHYLGASYMLASGAVIEGQSFSHLKQCLRDRYAGRKWRIGGGYYDLVEALEEAGFKVLRARTMRYTRNGQFKPYAECDVVTL